MKYFSRWLQDDPEVEKPTPPSVLRENALDFYRFPPQIEKIRKQDVCNGLILDPDAYLLAGDFSGKSMSFIDRNWTPVGGAVAFFAGTCISRLVARRPVLSGIHAHVLSSFGAFLVCSYFRDRKDAWAAERDLQYLEYIRNNPEDFASPEKVLYKDYLDPWVPVR